jgi:putative flippase GtrA
MKDGLGEGAEFFQDRKDNDCWMKNKRKKLFEILRFCLVGALASGLHYGIYYVLQLYINVNVAYALGYAGSLVCNFFLTTFFTFKKSPSVKKALGFLASHALNFVLHMALFNLLLYIGMGKTMAPIVVLCIVVPINYLVLRLWVYKK